MIPTVSTIAAAGAMMPIEQEAITGGMQPVDG